jgi:hypothetical protein
VAAVILLAGVGVAIWMALEGLSQKEKDKHGQSIALRGESNKADAGGDAAKKPEEAKPENPATKPEPAPDTSGKPDAAKPVEPDATPKPPSPISPSNPVAWFDEPRSDRVVAGKFVSAPAKGVPWLLIQRPSTSAGKEPWQGWERVQPESPVYSSDSLVALPGYRGEIRTEKGLGVYLWGNVPRYLLDHVPLFESAVTLHKSDEYDLDLSLDRGRILLANHKDKGPATVRLRFYDEGPKGRKAIWNITLQDPDTVVGLERLGLYTSDTPFGSGIGPQADLYLVLLHGKAGVKIDEFRTWNDLDAAGPALLEWNNRFGPSRPFPLVPQAMAFWDKSPPKTQQAELMLGALEQLDKNMTAKAALDVLLLQNLGNPQKEGRTLGVLCLGAIDDLPRLMDALGDEQSGHDDVRDAAAGTLRQWIGRRADNDAKLFQSLQKKYSKGQAEAIMQLLHRFPETARQSLATLQLLVQYLRSPKAAIRQLAFSELMRLVPEGRSIRYDPAGDSTQREDGYNKWKEVALDKPLPPLQQGSARPGAATAPPK